MSQPLIIVLLVLALVVPVASAIGVRVFAQRLQARYGYLLVGLCFAISAASTLLLANSNLTTLRIAGLTVLLPDNGGVALPEDLLPLIGTPIDPSLELPSVPDETNTIPEATIQPTPTQLPSPTARPTATPSPINTPQPSATTIPPTATSIPPTATASGPRRYTIQAGDTLRAIAERFGVTVQAILQANRLTPAQADALRPGQEIIIP